MTEVAIVAGVRTPFAKAGTDLAHTPADQLGRMAVQELLYRIDLDPNQVDEVILGNVAGPPDAANVARVIALTAGIPLDKPAHSVHRNCASGMEAITEAADAIRLGRAQVVIVGGTESMSNYPLLFRRSTTDLLTALMRAKGPWQRLKTIAKFRPRHFSPVISVTLGLTDPVCGMIMGLTAEKLAREFNVTRGEQDAFALTSHHKAVAAQKECRLADEITPVYVGTHHDKPVTQDVGPRDNQSLEALAKLKPYFDRKHGTVTVGNSCMITDGAVALAVMNADKAKALGHKPLGYLRSYAYAGVDPSRMGLGPTHATAKLIKQDGVTLNDFELIELNEAFAAQVIANERAMASKQYCQDHCGMSAALGELNRDILNVNGGALALGHPVGATGARLVLTLLMEMQRRGLALGLATLCVGGGQGAALALERR